MRLFGEIQYNWLQFALAETDDDLRCSARDADTGHVVMRDLKREKFDRRRTTPGPPGRRRLAVQPWQCDHQLFPVARDTPSRRDVGQLAGTPAVHLGVGGVAEPQFEASADLVLQCRPYLRPARGGHHDVNPERKTLSGNGGETRLERFEFLAQGGQAIDDQEDIAERIVSDRGITVGT